MTTDYQKRYYSRGRSEPPKLEKIPNPVHEKKTKKKEVEPLILNQDTEQKIFDEEPLVLDTIHNEPVQNTSENIKKKRIKSVTISKEAC